MHPLPGTADVIFLEIDIIDPSEFSNVLQIHGTQINKHPILRAESPAATQRNRGDPARHSPRHPNTATLPLRVVRRQPHHTPTPRRVTSAASSQHAVSRYRRSRMRT